MANTSQAKKRVRQAETRRKHNASQRSETRTAIKKTVSAIESGDAKSAEAELTIAIPVIDRAVTHGIFQKNKAARYKSRLNAKVKALKA